MALGDGMFILWFGAMKSGAIFYEEYYSVLDYKGFTVSLLIFIWTNGCGHSYILSNEDEIIHIIGYLF